MADEWNVLIADGLAQGGQDILAQSTQVVDRTGIDAETLMKDISDYDALIVRSRTQVSGALLSASKRLKVVGRAGVGVDSIDLEAAKSLGVTVVNSPLATTITVAEHTMALILSLARLVPRADASMKAGEWAKKSLRGTELYDKTLGVAGMGRIGSAVAQRAGAFRMQVLGYDPLLDDDQIRQNGATPADLETLYGQSDYLSLHVPLIDSTRNMIDETTLNRMKPGVRLICAARGGVIDEAALLAAIERGHVSGAALDVFAEEPPVGSKLVEHPNVVATPHIGAQTGEAQARAAEHIAAEVVAALKGENLRWRVV
jgi:D-3-phosphoglycerate dehydrogenase